MKTSAELLSSKVETQKTTLPVLGETNKEIITTETIDFVYIIQNWMLH